ncbi:MAG: mechanosensitive ion channel family protein [Anaerolineae bacterium]
MGIAESLQELLQQAIVLLPKLITAVIVFIITLVLSGIATRWARRFLTPKIESQEIVQLLARFLRWALIVVGTLAALEQVDFDVTTFIAGLGVTGLTIGFALQDIARNFVAGIILLVRKPFAIGQAISVAGHSGSVVDVNMRDTIIRTWDGPLVILPNIDVFGGAITNYSEESHRRRTIYIGVGYGQNLKRATEVFLAATSEVPGVVEDPAPMLHAEELGDSAVTFALRFWIDTTTHGLLDVHSDVVMAINTAAEREGIELPYPIQTVRLEGLPERAG